MKIKRWILMFFVLIIFAFAQTQALAEMIHARGFYSGNDLIVLVREYDLYSVNASGVDSVKEREYDAYIMGVYDATEYLYNTPNNVTKGQIIAVVSKYLKNNPEMWNKPTALLVGYALIEAFPRRARIEYPLTLPSHILDKLK